MTFPGLLFIPTDLGLVRRHLRDKVNNNKSGFIKTMNVYKDAPWRLYHDSNPLFRKNEWYYFVPRTKRGGNTVNRSVPRNGESQGGTWKATGKKKDIERIIKQEDCETKDIDEEGKKELIGYKQELVYNMNVHGKPNPVKTDWLMTEYSLHKDDDEFQDLVLCWIRHKNDEKLKLVPQVENNNNNTTVLPNQEQQEADFANQLETSMLEEERGDINQQQQEQEQETDFANQLEMSMLDEERGHVYQQQQQQQQQEQEQEQETDFANQLDMSMLEEERGGVNQKQQQQQQKQQQEKKDSPILHLPPLQSNDSQEHYPMWDEFCFDGVQDDIIMQIMDEGKDVTQKRLEQEDTTIRFFPPLQSNGNHQQNTSWDTVLVPQVENNNNIVLPNQEQKEACFANHQQQQQQQEQEDNQNQFPWDDFGFNGVEDDATIQIMYQGNDVTQKRQQQLEQELLQLLQPVPQAKDSGVYAGQVMPQDNMNNSG